MTDTLLSILILVGSPLLLILLHKIKIIDISYGIELLNNIKQGFISDYKAVKEKGITSILSNRWHLHALIGLGTVFTLALFKSIWFTVSNSFDAVDTAELKEESLINFRQLEPCGYARYSR